MPLVPSTTSADPSVAGLAAWGSSIKAQTFDPATISTATNPTAGQIRLSPIYVATPSVITGVKVLQTIQASSENITTGNKVGLYRLNGTNLELLASSAETNTLFRSGTGLQGAAFSSTYLAQPGQYWAAFIYNVTSAPVTQAAFGVRAASSTPLSGTLDFQTNLKSWGSVGAQTDLPSTIALSGVTNISNSSQIWTCLY